MRQRIPLINRPLKPRCVYIHKQDLLASQRAVPIKPRLPEGGAPVSLQWPITLTGQEMWLLHEAAWSWIYTWHKSLRDLLGTLTAQQLHRLYKFCIRRCAQFVGLSLKTMRSKRENPNVSNFSVRTPVYDNMLTKLWLCCLYFLNRYRTRASKVLD